MIFLALVALLLPVAARGQERAEQEEFLLKAPIISERQLYPGTMRISLDDGKRKHDATVQRVDGNNSAQRDGYRRNVAAYLLDQAIGLNLVPPTVERPINGQPAAVIWWTDGVAMNELDRRRKEIQPPDIDAWTKQMQAVRLFDELISNTYRNTSPEFYVTTLWDNLLITGDWKITIIDHKAAFRTSRQLENPTSLVQCDRDLLGKLRTLNKGALQQMLGQHLTADELDGLEARRVLLVTHFDEQIARKGEAAVLYDLPPRR